MAELVQAKLKLTRGTELGFSLSGVVWSRPAEVRRSGERNDKAARPRSGIRVHSGRRRPGVVFHRSAVKDGSFDQLNEGQRVSFDEEPSSKGPRAGNIRSEGASSAA